MFVCGEVGRNREGSDMSPVCRATITTSAKVGDEKAASPTHNSYLRKGMGKVDGSTLLAAEQT